MSNTDLNQNPAKSPGNVASDEVLARGGFLRVVEMVHQDTWDQLDEESLLLMTDKERGKANIKLCRIADPDCVACQ